MTEHRGIVYLIHFHSPLHHARHYIGFCEFGNLEQRLAAHRAGNGSKLMRAVSAAGIEWELAETWDNVDRGFERQLKRRKSTARFCPICRDKQNATYCKVEVKEASAV